MRTATIKWIISLCLILCLITTASAQRPTNFLRHAPDRLLVHVENTANSRVEANTYRNRLGATKLYETASGVQCWKFDGFPVTVTNSSGEIEVYNDIIEIQSGGKNKPKKSEIGLDYIVSTPSDLLDANGQLTNDYTPIPYCSDINVFCETTNNHNDLKIGVIDTGIGDEVRAISSAISIGYNYINDTNNPIDENGHGTQMTSIIAEMLELQAIDDVSIYPMKALAADGTGNLSDIIFAIDDAIAQGMNILNLSLGYSAAVDDPSTIIFQEAIQRAIDANILIVTAAGNYDTEIGVDDYYFFPAAFEIDGLLAVQAEECSTGRASFSNYGSVIDARVPGTDILCRDLDGSWILNHGTSHATAIATGIAMQLATHQNLFNATELACTFYNTATDIINSETNLNILLGGTCMPTNQGVDIMTFSFPNFKEIELKQNYPNPASDITFIEFSIPEEVQIAQVYITNFSGQIIQKIALNNKDTERLTLELDTFPAGTYFYSLILDSTIHTTRKMLVTK